MLLFIASLVCTAQAVIAPQQLTPAEIYKKCSPGIVTIQTREKSGTAFYVRPGVICTCFHIVAGAASATISVDGKQSGQVVSVEAIDRQKDIVFLNVDQTGFSLAEHWGNLDKASVGDPVVVIGSPEGLERTLTAGLISAKRISGASSILQLSAGVSPGSSGSPVFDAAGEVIGVVTSGMKEGQLLNFAISSNDALAVAGVPLAIACAASPPPAQVPQPSTRPEFDAVGWSKKVKDKLDEIKPELVKITPYSWTMPGSSVADAQHIIDPIAERHKATLEFLNYAIDVASKMSDSPSNLGYWLRLDMAVNQIADYIEVVTAYKGQPAFSVDYSYESSSALTNLATELIRLSSSGPFQPLVEFLSHI